MNLLRFIVALILITISAGAFAQGEDELSVIPENSVFLEAGGFGGYGSVNYERLLMRKGYLKLRLQAGIGTYKIKDFNRSFNPDVIIPFSVNLCYGRVHQVELDLGETWSSMVYAPGSERDAERNNFLSTNLGIGYRYQKEQKGLFFRLAYTPFFEQLRIFRNWWGVAIGYGF